MNESALRLLLLLKHIPREPIFISSKALLERMQDEGYSVSLRTIQRDLSSLSLHFPLIQNAPQGRGKTGVGWAFSRDAQHTSFPLMGHATALTLCMAMQHLKHLLPAQVLEHLEPFRMEAVNSLSRHRGLHYRDWFEKVRVVPQALLQQPAINDETIELLYQALLENRQCRATYKGVPDRVIHPYGLVQQGHTIYLICRFYDYEDIRLTALHRYSEIQILEDPVHPYPEFSIDDYLDEGAMSWPTASRELLDLELELDQCLAEYVAEVPLSDDQKITGSGRDSKSCTLTAKVLDSQQLRYWLLSQGAQLEIIKPQELRQWMLELVQVQLKKYE